MNSRRPLVTVVIPTRDRWALLARTLASAVGQRGLSHEVVVVDDGSTAPPPPALLESPGGVPVRMFRHSEALGVARARNRGIEEARGEWVAFLDDDDLWAPEKLAAQLAALDLPRTDFAYGAALMVSPALDVLATLPPPPAEQLLDLLSVRSAIPAGASNVIVRAELLRRLGGFDPDLAQLADWDLWLRLATATRPAVVAAPLIAYVQHPANMLANERSPDILAEFRRLEGKHAGTAGDSGRSLHGGGLTMWATERHWRAGQRRRATRAAMSGAIIWRDPRVVPWLLKLPLRDVRRWVRQRRSSSSAAPAPAWLEALR